MRGFNSRPTEAPAKAEQTALGVRGILQSEMTTRIPIVDLRAEYAEVGSAIEEAVLRVLRSGAYVLGPETRAFEDEMASLVGARFAVGVGSGTEALVLALRACGIGPGDDVLTTPFTYVATVEAILMAGARPVFADIETGGFNLDPEAAEAALTPATRAILPVHLFGRCADMVRLRAVADRHDLALIEDAAQAIGAQRGGRSAGAWGDAGCFSFYPAKSLGAAGDGGCITTDHGGLAERLRLLRSHGFAGAQGHLVAGTASRLDSLQAAVLRAKLPHLKRWLDAREAHVERYRAALGDRDDVRLPEREPGERPAWSHLTLRSPRVAVIRDALDAENVEWRCYYPRPVYREPAFEGEAFRGASCPEAERACEEVISVPIHPGLPAEAVERVCGAIRRALQGRMDG